MCDTKPGVRCANDTRDAAVALLERYDAAHPDGPPVSVLDSAEARFNDDYLAGAADSYARTFDAFVPDVEPTGERADLRGEPTLSFADIQSFLARAAADQRRHS